VLGDRHRGAGICHARDNLATGAAGPRATAFGVFYAVYGIAWFAGSVLLGVLYDLSVPAVAIASMALQAAALPVLYRLTRPPAQ
jgi:predicted MFS family arabinose efflux permease